MTLSEVLASQSHCLDLRRFCAKEFSTENIDFLLLARKLNPLLGSAGVGTFPPDKSTAVQRARYLYDRFVAPREDSAKRVAINISSSNKTTLTAAATANLLGATSFDAAHNEIYAMVDRDTFPRFLRSDDGLGCADTRERSAAIV